MDMSIGNVVTAAALLLSVGLNGLAIWFYKDYEQMDEENHELHTTMLDQAEEIEAAHAVIRTQREKLTPWNKGKSGYKQQRKAKQVVATIGEYADYPPMSEVLAAELSKAGV